jgi:hypothetical protein
VAIVVLLLALKTVRQSSYTGETVDCAEITFRNCSNSKL